MGGPLQCSHGIPQQGIIGRQICVYRGKGTLVVSVCEQHAASNATGHSYRKYVPYGQKYK